MAATTTPTLQPQRPTRFSDLAANPHRMLPFLCFPLEDTVCLPGTTITLYPSTSPFVANYIQQYKQQQQQQQHLPLVCLVNSSLPPATIHAVDFSFSNYGCLAQPEIIEKTPPPSPSPPSPSENDDNLEDHQDHQNHHELVLHCTTPVFILDTTATNLEYPGALMGLEYSQYAAAMTQLFYSISAWQQHATYVMGACLPEREMETHFPRGSLMHHQGGLESGMYWQPQIYMNFDAAGLVTTLMAAVQKRYNPQFSGLTQYLDHLRTTCRLSLREVAAPFSYFVAAHLLPLSSGCFTYGYKSLRIDAPCTVECILAMESVIARLRLLIYFIHNTNEVKCECDKVMCTIDKVAPLLMSDCDTTPTLLVEYPNTNGIIFRTKNEDDGSNNNNNNNNSDVVADDDSTTTNGGIPLPLPAPPSTSAEAHCEWLQPRQGISVPIAAKCFTNRYSAVHDIIMVKSIDNGAISVEDEDAGPVERDSWVKGYGWQIVNCRGCDQHVGWKFTRMERRSEEGGEEGEWGEVDRGEVFYGIRRSCLKQYWWRGMRGGREEEEEEG